MPPPQELAVSPRRWLNFIWMMWCWSVAQQLRRWLLCDLAVDSCEEEQEETDAATRPQQCTLNCRVDSSGLLTSTCLSSLRLPLLLARLLFSLLFLATGGGGALRAGGCFHRAGQCLQRHVLFVDPGFTLVEQAEVASRVDYCINARRK